MRLGSYGAMNRGTTFDLCEQFLTWHCTRIEARGKLNLLNLHLHCEDFYAHFLNLLFGYQLKNLNAIDQNAAGVDLVDAAGKILLQVSATATKAKVNAALEKDLSAYTGHAFRFVSISKDAAHLRGHTYTNPHKLAFDPKSDIYDVPSLLTIILHMEISGQRKVYEFLRDELEPAPSRMLPESNLAAVIGVISREDLSSVATGATSIPFNVDDKLKANDLHAAAGVIEDYKIHHHRVERIYGEFDVAGVNKSKSVLDSFRSIYLKLSAQYSGDELYFQVVEQVMKKVRESANYVQIPLEELELCTNVLAVDAFIRCRIFKEPMGVGDAFA
jgi:hypothetical protein